MRSVSWRLPKLSLKNQEARLLLHIPNLVLLQWWVEMVYNVEAKLGSRQGVGYGPLETFSRSGGNKLVDGYVLESQCFN